MKRRFFVLLLGLLFVFSSIGSIGALAVNNDDTNNDVCLTRAYLADSVIDIAGDFVSVTHTERIGDNTYRTERVALAPKSGHTASELYTEINNYVQTRASSTTPPYPGYGFSLVVFCEYTLAYTEWGSYNAALLTKAGYSITITNPSVADITYQRLRFSCSGTGTTYATAGDLITQVSNYRYPNGTGYTLTVSSYYPNWIRVVSSPSYDHFVGTEYWFSYKNANGDTIGPVYWPCIPTI